MLLNERVFSKQKSLHARIKRMNRKTFASAKTKVTKSKQVKNAEMEQDALKSVINLVEKSGVIELKDLLENRVIQESTSLFNPDGTYRKNAKSQLLQKMHKDITPLHYLLTCLTCLLSSRHCMRHTSISAMTSSLASFSGCEG